MEVFADTMDLCKVVRGLFTKLHNAPRTSPPVGLLVEFQKLLLVYFSFLFHSLNSIDWLNRTWQKRDAENAKKKYICHEYNKHAYAMCSVQGRSCSDNLVNTRNTLMICLAYLFPI